MFRKRGFTLLELIIVVIVIGILASIGLPRFMRVTEKARTSEAKTGLAAIRSAQIRYYAQYLNYSGVYANLDADVGSKYFTFNTSGTSTRGDSFVYDYKNGAVVGVATRNVNEQFTGGSDPLGYEIAISADGKLNITPGDEYLL